MERSAKFTLDTTDWRKTGRDFLIFATACAIPALMMITDAIVKGETYDPQVIWIAFSTPFIAGFFAGINRWLTNYQQKEEGKNIE